MPRLADFSQWPGVLMYNYFGQSCSHDVGNMMLCFLLGRCRARLEERTYLWESSLDERLGEVLSHEGLDRVAMPV